MKANCDFSTCDKKDKGSLWPNGPKPREGTRPTGKALAAVLIVICMGLALGFLTGCSTEGFGGAERFGYDTQVVTNQGAILATNTTLTTNLVVTSASTNAVTGVVTPAQIQQVVTPEISYVYAAPHYTTNLVERPIVTEGLKGMAAVPVPFAGTAAIILGWAYSAWAAFRNKQVSRGLVKSVEAARDWLKTTPEGQSVDAKFVEVLASHQDTAGVLKAVESLLQKHT